MGENVNIVEQSASDRLREQIRHTESDITETVQTLEDRLSPSHLRERGTRKVKLAAWRGTAKVLEFAQRRPVQLSLLGASALLMVLGTRKARTRAVRRPPVTGMDAAGSLAKALGAGALWMFSRRKGSRVSQEERPAVSGLALAATAAKAFFGGKRQSEKSGTTRPGRKEAWTGLATAIGAALGSRFSHGHRV